MAYLRVGGDNKSFASFRNLAGTGSRSVGWLDDWMIGKSELTDKAAQPANRFLR